MPLEDLKLDPGEGTPPPTVRAFLRDADRRIERFLRARTRGPVPAFVPSDFPPVYRALRIVRDTHLAPGDLFCEWGSGLGVAACLAAMLGFHAHGIEINADLVGGAEGLAEDYGLAVRFARGTFIPAGSERFVDHAADFAWLDAGGACGHDELGLDPTEVDVVFAYPWPGEERVIEDLFEHVSADGTVLLTYHGLEGIQAQRKTGDRDPVRS